MSLESALEEERLEILKLLDRSNARSPPPQVRSHNASSPLGSRTTSPSRARVTSLIDIASGPSPGLASQKSPNSSPTLTFSSPATNGLHRNSANAAPRLLRDRDKHTGFTSHEDYQFSMISSVPPIPPAPKRVATKGSKPIRSMLGGGAGDDRFGKLPKPSASPATIAALRAKGRSTSPKGWQTDSARSSSGRLSSPPPPDNRHSIISEDGTTIDLHNAYRRLNDEALASSGGILGSLPEKKAVLNAAGEHIRAGSGESITREGGIRLQKDYDPGNERAIVDSSDDESTEGESTEGEDDEDGRRRGRRKKRTNRGSDSEEDSVKKIEGTMPGGGNKVRSLLSIGSGSTKKKGEKGRPMSLLAAADEERMSSTNLPKYR